MKNTKVNLMVYLSSVALFLTILFAIGLYVVQYVDRDDIVLNNIKKETSSVIAYTQWMRVHGIRADIGIFGDSIASNSLVAQQIATETGFSIESFSTTGYCGPEGYAELVDVFFTYNPDSYAVIAISPTQFYRLPEWRPYGKVRKIAQVLQREAKASVAGGPFYRRCLLPIQLYAKRLLDTPFVSAPMNQAFGGYSHFQHIIAETGNYPSPQIVNGMNLSLEEYMSQESEPISWKLRGGFVPDMTPEYIAVLGKLKSVIQKYGFSRFFLTVLPIPDNAPPEKLAKHAKSASALLEYLGLPRSQYIETAPGAPSSLYGDGRHFHKPGSQYMSHIFADAFKRTFRRATIRTLEEHAQKE